LNEYNQLKAKYGPEIMDHATAICKINPGLELDPVLRKHFTLLLDVLKTLRNVTLPIFHWKKETKEAIRFYKDTVDMYKKKKMTEMINYFSI
jgi:hypothetical protein